MGLFGGTARRVLLSLCAFVFVMLSGPRVAFAQGGRREIEVLDWAYHVPLAFACVLVVVIVDAIVIILFVRRGGR